MSRDHAAGSVYVAPVPFEDGRGLRRRPVVVVGSRRYWEHDRAAVVCPVTTAEARPGDVSLDWRAASLRRPSRVRPRPITLAKDLLEWEVGALAKPDLAALKRALKDVLDLG